MKKYLYLLASFSLMVLLSAGACEPDEVGHIHNQTGNTSCEKLDPYQCSVAPARCVVLANGECETIIVGTSCNDFHGHQIQCERYNNNACDYDLSSKQCELRPHIIARCDDAKNQPDCLDAHNQNHALNCTWNGANCIDFVRASFNSVITAFETFLADLNDANKASAFTSKFDEVVIDSLEARHFMGTTLNNNNRILAELFKHFENPTIMDTLNKLYVQQPQNWLWIDTPSNGVSPLKSLLSDPTKANFNEVLTIAIKVGAEIDKLPTPQDIDNIIGHIAALPDDANDLLMTAYGRAPDALGFKPWILHAFTNDLTNLEKLAQSYPDIRNASRKEIIGDLLEIAADKAKETALSMPDDAFDGTTDDEIKKFLDLFDNNVLFPNLELEYGASRDNALTLAIKRFMLEPETVATNTQVSNLAKLTASKIKAKLDVDEDEWRIYASDTNDILRDGAGLDEPTRNTILNTFFLSELEWKANLESMAYEISQFGTPGHTSKRDPSWLDNVKANKEGLENWFKRNQTWTTSLDGNVNKKIFKLSENSLNNIAPSLPKNIFFKVAKNNTPEFHGLTYAYLKYLKLASVINSALDDFDRLVLPSMVFLNVEVNGTSYRIFATEKIDLYGFGNFAANKELYYYMLNQPTLATLVEKQYLQLIRAMCTVGFGNIRFDNIPFSADGQGLVLINMDKSITTNGLNTLFDLIPPSFKVDNNNHSTDTTNEVLGICSANINATFTNTAQTSIFNNIDPRIDPTEQQKESSEKKAKFYQKVFNMWETKGVSSGNEHLDTDQINNSPGFGYEVEQYWILFNIVSIINGIIGNGERNGLPMLQKRCLIAELPDLTAMGLYNDNLGRTSEVNGVIQIDDQPLMDQIKQVIRDLKNNNIIISRDPNDDTKISAGDCF